MLATIPTGAAASRYTARQVLDRLEARLALRPLVRGERIDRDVARLQVLDLPLDRPRPHLDVDAVDVQVRTPGADDAEAETMRGGETLEDRQQRAQIAERRMRAHPAQDDLARWPHRAGVKRCVSTIVGSTVVGTPFPPM